MITRNHWIHELAMQRGISIKTVEQTLRGAKRNGVVDSTLDHVRVMRDESLRLFLDGEMLASMWAGQAMWEAAASVAYAIRDKYPLFLAYRTLDQRRVAGFSSGNERQSERKPEWVKWQFAVDKERAANPQLSKSRIFEIVATSFGVTRQAIGKRVIWR